MKTVQREDGALKKGGTGERRKYLELTAGTMISVVGLQLFITPAGLYNGGTIGLSRSSAHFWRSIWGCHSGSIWQALSIL